MRERLGIESGILPEEGRQTLLRGARSHRENHYFCVPVGESVNWWIGGGRGLTEGQKYTVYPRDSYGQPYEYHPEGVFVHINWSGRKYATVEQLHEQVKALGYAAPSAVIITDPPKDETGTIGYLVKVAEVPKPAWETEWDDGKQQQKAVDDFLHFIQRGPGATSI